MADAAESNPEASVENLESSRKDGDGEPRLHRYFKAAIETNASDLHLKAGASPRLRISGAVKATSSKPLSSDVIEQMMFDVMTEEQIETYQKTGNLDFGYLMGAKDRFRVNLFRQRGKTSVAARRIPTEILSYEQLHLPQTLSKIAGYPSGLVLVSGITGCGKSTTIASMIEEINQTRSCHIVTLEDPIEFEYEDKKAFVNQREIGLDVADFNEALRYLMREDPDVVLIGELRDQETISAALHASESGHLVFGTVHASGTMPTITRLLELFPEDTRELVRSSLVTNLRAIVCQKLLAGIQPGVPLVPAVEILLANPTIRKLILEGREHDAMGVVRNSPHDGMQDFNESLRQLVESEFIAAKTAYKAAPNADQLKMMLKGIKVSGGGIIG